MGPGGRTETNKTTKTHTCRGMHANTHKHADTQTRTHTLIKTA